jgi:uncharacterized protein YkwD
VPWGIRALPCGVDRLLWRARLRTVLTVALLLLVAAGFTACSASLPAGGPAAETEPVDDPAGSGPPGGDEPAPEPDPQPDPDPAFGATALRLLELVNEARAEPRTCGARGGFDATHPLALEARLVRAAQGHSDDMHANAFFDHTGSDGSSPADRVTREGYVWAAVGETIASGQSTPERVVSAWLASDGHCAILMGPGYAELGAGETSLYWTLVFARSR